VDNFEVALSFAGEQRWYVDVVNSELKSLGIATFYDEDWQVELWGKDLNETFTEIYSKQAKAVLMFISKEYVEKVWTKVERRAALSRAINEKGEYILPVRFDHTAVPGMPSTVGYLYLQDLSARQLAQKVCRKIGREIPNNLISSGPSIEKAARKSASSKASSIGPVVGIRSGASLPKPSTRPKAPTLALS